MTRFINCEACQTEGRILTNDGGPDDVDRGVCPECNGERVVEVETRPVELEENAVMTGVHRSQPISEHSPREWPVAWVCDDERYPFVCGIVTTSAETVAAWVESGIKFAPLVRRTSEGFESKLADATLNPKVR